MQKIVMHGSVLSLERLPEDQVLVRCAIGPYRRLLTFWCRKDLAPREGEGVKVTVESWTAEL